MKKDTPPPWQSLSQIWYHPSQGRSLSGRDGRGKGSTKNDIPSFWQSISYVPYLKYIARKPRSFFNVPIREMMPAGLVSYIDSLPNGEKGRILSELDVLASAEGFGKAVDILSDRLKRMFVSDRQGPDGGSHSERLDIPYALKKDPADTEDSLWP